MRSPEQVHESLVQKFSNHTIPLTDRANVALISSFRFLAKARHNGNIDAAFQAVRDDVEQRCGRDVIGQEMVTWQALTNA